MDINIQDDPLSKGSLFIFEIEKNIFSLKLHHFKLSKIIFNARQNVHFFTAHTLDF